MCRVDVGQRLLPIHIRGAPRQRRSEHGQSYRNEAIISLQVISLSAEGSLSSAEAPLASGYPCFSRGSRWGVAALVGPDTRPRFRLPIQTPCLQN